MNSLLTNSVLFNSLLLLCISLAYFLNATYNIFFVLIFFRYYSHYYAWKSMVAKWHVYSFYLTICMHTAKALCWMVRVPLFPSTLCSLPYRYGALERRFITITTMKVSRITTGYYHNFKILKLILVFFILFCTPRGSLTGDE